MKVLITRQKNFAEKTKDLLTQINIDSVIAPVIEINYLDVKKEIENSINIYDFIILTSQNSLIGLDKNFNMNNLKSKKFLCIGPSTASLLANYSLESFNDPMPEFSSEKLISQIEQIKDFKNSNYLICKGIGGKQTLSEFFKKSLISFNEIFLYERITKIQNIDDIGEFTHIFVTSNDILKNLEHNFANKDQSFWIDKVIVAGNNKIAEKIKFSTKKVIVANNPTDEEMIKTLLKNI